MMQEGKEEDCIIYTGDENVCTKRNQDATNQAFTNMENPGKLKDLKQIFG